MKEFKLKIVFSFNYVLRVLIYNKGVKINANNVLLK